MKSSKCQKCSLVQWAESDACKRCGASLGNGITSPLLSASTVSTENDVRSVPPAQPTPGYQYALPELKSGLAIASMVVAIIAFPTTFLLIGIILAPVAVTMGIVALVRANRKPTIYGGKGFAIAGISVGSVVCLFFVPLIAAIAIPNLLAARRAANEGSALSVIETIALAQDKHSMADESGVCGDLMTLASKNLIAGELAAGEKNGYTFVAGGNQSDEDGCEVRATPESPSQGNRSFYFSSADGVVRVAKNGSPANHTDPPMTEYSRASN
jgi:type II secretory pathway pseudopilin PulG